MKEQYANYRNKCKFRTELYNKNNYITQQKEVTEKSKSDYDK